MTDLEIPLVEDRGLRYRLFEMLPAFMSWGTIFMPAILALFDPLWAAFFIISYILIWFFKSIAMAYRVLQGYSRMDYSMKLDWRKLLNDLDRPEKALAECQQNPKSKLNQVHARNLSRYLSSEQTKYLTTEVTHIVMVALYNESIEIIEPTIQAVVGSNFDVKKQVVLVIAYEERGGESAEQTVRKLVERYGDKFKHVMTFKHPDGLPNEVRGKGGNITYAATQMMGWVTEQKIDTDTVLVTTLDSDNRPHRNYLAALSYTFLVSENRQQKSYQPIPLYTNNIWDVPAPMRVIAVGNSFWQVIQSVRPHLLRNFSSHAQPLTALLKTNFWSVRTIVEDGHQFWRSYFAFDGKYEVVTIFAPIYQDAVLAEGYRRTLKAQFIQLRRWAWGASDVAYVADKAYFNKENKNVPKVDAFIKMVRLLEGHVSWASSSILLAGSAWLPLFLNARADELIIAQQLPIIASRVQTVAMLGIFLALYFNLKTLPPKPERYKNTRHFWMLVQWVWLPVLTIVYGGFTSLYSQTRIFLGRYIGQFDVTEKAIKR